MAFTCARTRLASCLAVAGLSLCAATASAQSGGTMDSTDRVVLEALQHGDDLHRRLRPLDALEAYQEVMRRDSTHAGASWRAAREAVNLGMLTGDPGASREWYESAVRYGRRAVAHDSSSAQAWTWLAIALGRHALDQGPRTRVRLAEEIKASAARALALDSAAAAAHHVLGEWHAEIRRLGGLTRFAARTLLGADVFDEATWQKAELHLQRAVELEPEGLIHRLALARVLIDLDRNDEARSQLQDVLRLPAIEPTDARHKQEAQDLLRRMG